MTAHTLNSVIPPVRIGPVDVIERRPHGWRWQTGTGHSPHATWMQRGRKRLRASCRSCSGVCTPWRRFYMSGRETT